MVFNKVGIRSYTYTLDDSNYTTLKAQNETQTSMTYEGVTGEPKFNDTDKTLTLTRTLTYAELVSEAGSELPENGGELRDFYTSKGNVCSLGY